jgi:putative ABC transport system ATP-binding protein
MDLLFKFSAQGYSSTEVKPVTMVMATHNPDIECYADRVLYIKDGVITQQAINAEPFPLDYEGYLEFLKQKNDS